MAKQKNSNYDRVMCCEVLTGLLERVKDINQFGKDNEYCMCGCCNKSDLIGQDYHSKNGSQITGAHLYPVIIDDEGNEFCDTEYVYIALFCNRCNCPERTNHIWIRPIYLDPGTPLLRIKTKSGCDRSITSDEEFRKTKQKNRRMRKKCMYYDLVLKKQYMELYDEKICNQNTCITSCVGNCCCGNTCT